MAIKATDRVKIQAYGGELGATFTEINNALDQLVAGVAAANYEGGNAVQFKQTCVNSCVSFAEQVRIAMTQMSSDVAEQTSFIAQNLGGAPVEVPAPTMTLEAPPISTDESVELADSEALTSMITLVEERMSQIQGSFDANMDAFQLLGSTDGWVGEEYDTLFGQISGTTEEVKGDIDTSSASIVATIQGQLDALGM